MVPRHSIKLALDISLAPTRLQGPLSLRSSSLKTVSCARAMASARHAIDSRDASLLPMGVYVHAYNHMTWRPCIASLLSMVPRRVAILLLLLWAFLRLRRTHGALRASKERRFLRRWSGSAPFHQLALDIRLAPTCLQGPLSPRSSSQKTFSYARARRVLGMP